MKKINIGNKLVGEEEPCFVVAEAGVNHNGNLDCAKRMIEIASDIGADAVKFQTGKVEETVTKNAPLAEYQKNSKTHIKSQYQMIKKWEFAEEEWFELADFAKNIDIIFFSKPSYEGAVDLLVKMGVPAIKIGSGDVTYLTLLRRVAKTGLPIILSTGMSTLGEIEAAINTIYSEKNTDIILLHCTSNYPPIYADLNLKAMLTLKQAFQVPVGYSDHSLGITVPIAAVSLGACVIEKHFTLDKNLPGPDHKASLEPHEFKEMVRSIRIAEEALGSPIKKPVEAEKEMRMIARKSIVANVDITEGEIIKREMLSFKRPGTGLPQTFLDLLVGRKARIDIKKDDIINWDMV